MRQIAKQYDISVATVWRKLHEYNDEINENNKGLNND